MGFEYSEISRRQKRRIYIFFFIFVIGFVFLGLIGKSINDNGFVILAFIAPLAIFIGIIGIALSLYRKDTDDQE